MLFLLSDLEIPTAASLQQGCPEPHPPTFPHLTLFGSPIVNGRKKWFCLEFPNVGNILIIKMKKNRLIKNKYFQKPKKIENKRKKQSKNIFIFVSFWCVSFWLAGWLDWLAELTGLPGLPKTKISIFYSFLISIQLKSNRKYGSLGKSLFSIRF